MRMEKGDQRQTETATGNIVPLRLRLYVLGSSPRSMAALFNLLELGRQFAGKWTLEVIDAAEEPARAIMDQILDFPTLVKLSPSPVEIIEGDLSNRRLVLTALGIEDDVDRARPQ